MFLDPVLYLGFCTAAAVVIITPGPVVTMVVAASLAHDVRAGVLIALGAGAANLLLLTAAIAGLAAAALQFGDWFPLIRIAGGLFLLWIGIETFRAGRGDLGREQGNRRTDSACFRQGFVIGISNPKTIVFFAAFLTRFLSADYPPLPQLTAMGGAFLVMGTASDSAYALAAGKARALLSGPRAKDNMRYLSGGVLVTLGLLLILGNAA